MGRVSIVTLFSVLEASISADWFESGLEKTARGATIAVVCVPIIALLAGAYDSVTAMRDDTRFESTGIRAPVSRPRVLVFTFLLQREEDAVTAAVEDEGEHRLLGNAREWWEWWGERCERRKSGRTKIFVLAVARASVATHPVPIVTFLARCLDTIPTVRAESCFKLAAAGATVSAECIPVVALLAAIECAIPAERRRTADLR